MIVQDVITKLSAHPDYDLFMEFLNHYPQKRTIILMLNDSVSYSACWDGQALLFC